jgi:hypothetical protein
MLLALPGCGAHRGSTESARPLMDAGSSLEAAASAPATAQQYTFTMASFEVPSGAEYYECQDILNPFGNDIAIVKSESTTSMGAHHMFAFDIPFSTSALAPDASAPDGASLASPDGSASSIFDCPAGGLEFHPYLHLTQRAHNEMTYPEGVGRLLPQADVIRLNVHYLNVSSSPIQVSAEVTVTYVDPSTVNQLASWIFVYSQSLQVPVGTSTQTFAYPVTADMKLIQANGHMHRRGTHFEAHAIAADAGEMRPLYSSDTWDEPPSLHLEPPFEIKKGDSLGYSCTYNNDTGAALTYGESAATNEMCNFFGVFYPSANGTGLVMGL